MNITTCSSSYYLADTVTLGLVSTTNAARQIERAGRFTMNIIDENLMELAEFAGIKEGRPNQSGKAGTDKLEESGAVYRTVAGSSPAAGAHLKPSACRRWLFCFRLIEVATSGSRPSGPRWLFRENRQTSLSPLTDHAIRPFILLVMVGLWIPRNEAKALCDLSCAVSSILTFHAMTSSAYCTSSSM
ncbi:Uncharacterised protein [Scardovia inopinata]|uniref:Flavin reductase like domain-containing protein n=2 Tax=Scardovia inopinata TaxID=78259 RepID=W5IGZ6_SCAIO|nr:hypothetical protein HMPREF9020_01334 [Scardovia inopinata F0304]SUV51187.1 Uncharacterised protein [Scardovia inopinata]